MPDNLSHPIQPDMPTTNSSQSSKPIVSDHSPEKPIGSPKQHGNWRGLASIVILFLSAGLLAWFLTVFVFQQYQVDGPSMQTTLQNGNRLIVWKLPRSWARLTGHAYIPKRGDIVIFTENNLYNLDGTNSNQLIKRVIGLPNDRVVVKNGTVTIYNKQYPQGFRPDATLLYGKVIPITSGDEDLVVPPGQIFVMGDNRSDSLDSRVFGTVPAKNIVGQLVVRISPLNEIEKF